MEKSMVKKNAKISFQILPEIFSGKSFMHWAPCFFGESGNRLQVYYVYY